MVKMTKTRGEKYKRVSLILCTFILKDLLVMLYQFHTL
jgi:hypothetical protein